MSINFCLNDTELESVIMSVFNCSEIDNIELRAKIKNAKEWENKLLCLTYSFSKILEKHSEIAQRLIPILFLMPQRMFFDIQDCGEEFVEYMLQHENSSNNNLEESLVIVARNLSEHLYEKSTLRN